MKEIIEYVKQRKKNGIQKVGVLVGSSLSGSPISIGWSKVMLRQKGENKDTFDKTRGLEIARGRLNGTGRNVVLPYIIRKKIPAFQERCLRYFKFARLNREF